MTKVALSDDCQGLFYVTSIVHPFDGFFNLLLRLPQRMCEKRKVNDPERSGNSYSKISDTWLSLPLSLIALIRSVDNRSFT